jgi:hypothetical protein
MTEGDAAVGAVKEAPFLRVHGAYAPRPHGAPARSQAAPATPNPSAPARSVSAPRPGPAKPPQSRRGLTRFCLACRMEPAIPLIQNLAKRLMAHRYRFAVDHASGYTGGPNTESLSHPQLDRSRRGPKSGSASRSLSATWRDALLAADRRERARDCYGLPCPKTIQAWRRAHAPTDSLPAGGQAHLRRFIAP